MPYRNVIIDGQMCTETYASYIPQNACISLRDERAGVDSANFYEWAKYFVESVRSATAGDRKLLLTYDAYRAHLSVRVLSLFLDHGIIAYALPAHTCCALQPCDLAVFARFKTELNDEISAMVTPGHSSELDMYMFCGALRSAYLRSFAPELIQASFKRAGMWPLDAGRFLTRPIPADHNLLHRLVTVEELSALMQKKREQYALNITGADVQISRCG